MNVIVLTYSQNTFDELVGAINITSDTFHFGSIHRTYRGRRFDDILIHPSFFDRPKEECIKILTDIEPCLSFISPKSTIKQYLLLLEERECGEIKEQLILKEILKEIKKEIGK